MVTYLEVGKVHDFPVREKGIHTLYHLRAILASTNQFNAQGFRLTINYSKLNSI